MKIGIIGGGAAGFFAAINAAEVNPNAKIYILEKTTKLLSKVKVSGGGRCNVTNATFENSNLAKNYPRGTKELRKAFDKFSPENTVQWFESRGVKLKTEEDKRIFPLSDDSQTIIDCFLAETKRLDIKIYTQHSVKQITPPTEEKNFFTLSFHDQESLIFDRILISTGGYNNIDAYNWIRNLNHSIINPVPSLFTFNVPDSKYTDLQGIAVPSAKLKITGIKNEQEGPLLITHWGLSGPSVLRLSAWEARTLSERNYEFTAMINLLSDQTEESIMVNLKQYKTEHPKQTIIINPLFSIPKRLWERVCELSGISATLKWGDVPQKSLNKLMEELIRSNVIIKGKTTFKEEFVTCGGIDLKQVNFETMESKVIPGLYFAGEVLDIDGITGGFNFQAAWTTGFIAGKNIGIPSSNTPPK